VEEDDDPVDEEEGECTMGSESEFEYVLVGMAVADRILLRRNVFAFFLRFIPSFVLVALIGEISWSSIVITQFYTTMLSFDLISLSPRPPPVG